MKLEYVYLLVANCDIDGGPHSEVIGIFDKMSTALRYCLNADLVPESDLTDLIDDEKCFIFKPTFKWYNSPLDPWGVGTNARCEIRDYEGASDLWITNGYICFAMMTKTLVCLKRWLCFLR